MKIEKLVFNLIRRFELHPGTDHVVFLDETNTPRAVQVKQFIGTYNHNVDPDQLMSDIDFSLRELAAS